MTPVLIGKDLVLGGLKPQKGTNRFQVYIYIYILYNSYIVHETYMHFIHYCCSG